MCFTRALKGVNTSGPFWSIRTASRLMPSFSRGKCCTSLTCSILPFSSFCSSLASALRGLLRLSCFSQKTCHRRRGPSFCSTIPLPWGRRHCASWLRSAAEESIQNHELPRARTEGNWPDSPRCSAPRGGLAERSSSARSSVTRGARRMA